MPFKNYREQSRDVQWGSEGNPNLDQINCGSMLRIADAAEKMAASYDQMRKDRDYWKGRTENLKRDIKILAHSNAGLRGYIKRLKGKA